MLAGAIATGVKEGNGFGILGDLSIDRPVSTVKEGDEEDDGEQDDKQDQP